MGRAPQSGLGAASTPLRNLISLWEARRGMDGGPVLGEGQPALWEKRPPRAADGSDCRLQASLGSGNWACGPFPAQVTVPCKVRAHASPAPFRKRPPTQPLEQVSLCRQGEARSSLLCRAPGVGGGPEIESLIQLGACHTRKPKIVEPTGAGTAASGHRKEGPGSTLNVECGSVLPRKVLQA